MTAITKDTPMSNAAPATTTTTTKRQRLAGALGVIVTACELLEVLVPHVVEFVSDVREVLELDGSPDGGSGAA